MTVWHGYKIATEISNRIKSELGITVSIGVSFDKIYAKLGSDYKKPDAITTMYRDEIQQKAWCLPASDLLYVGRSTDAKLKKIGIRTIGDLARTDEQILISQFGKMGSVLWSFANGYDDSPVKKENTHAPIKSVGNSTTTPRDLLTDVLWRILSGKITPSEILCEDILELLAIIDHNSKFEKKEALCEVEDIRIQEIWRVQRKAYKLKMQQLGVFAVFIAQYLEKIKNYSIDGFTLVKILNGFATPTAELYEEMEQLLDIVAKTLMRCIFPLSDKQLGMLGGVSISVNPDIKYKNAIPIIMCRNRNSFYDRYSQYKRLERFANNNEITLNTMYVHYLHDASWYNLKDAFDIVESGGSDVVLMYSEEIFISSELKQRACMYAYSHNIPIVFLSDVYYRN